MASRVNLIKYLKNNYQSFSNSSEKIEEEAALPNTILKASITMIPKLDKDTIRKENYRSISPMRASLVVQWKRICLPMQKMVQSLVWEDPVEKEIVTHSNILAWRIQWTEEPCGLQSIGSHRVEHD